MYTRHCQTNLRKILLKVFNDYYVYFTPKIRLS